MTSALAHLHRTIRLIRVSLAEAELVAVGPAELVVQGRDGPRAFDVATGEGDGAVGAGEDDAGAARAPGGSDGDG